ncbi:MAG: efflux RND transporter periplasmic adaptor subunit [Rhizobiales bacterium]|nr:efflux RND transporter periplasmic adaptor subunit [Hyphomicrobiales bacterium]
MNVQTLPDQAEIARALGLDARSRRRKWRGRLLWLVLLAVATAAGTWWYLDQQQRAAKLSYVTAPAAYSDMVIKVEATGNIQPTTQVDVSSELSGVIRTVAVDFNSVVKKGDVLAELDAVKLRRQLGRAKASLAAAEAQVLTARATVEETDLAFKRARALQDKGISSTQDLNTAQAARDRATAGLALAEANVRVAEADVALQQTDVDKTRIVSPVDGIVLKRNAEPGQTVASSLQAPVLFTLAEDLTRMQVEAAVDEADIGAVATGQQAVFTVDAYPGRAFPAVIQMIENSPRLTENVVTYTAILGVDNGALLLRPGMTATAEIVVRQIPHALVVPNGALRYEPPKAPDQRSFSITSLFLPRIPHFEPSANKPTGNGERTLYVLEKGQPAAVAVKTGASDGQVTEVLSGDLKEGDKVIVSVKTGQP